MKTVSLLICLSIYWAIFAESGVFADEQTASPRHVFVRYFQLMHDRRFDQASSLKTPRCIDHLHRNIRNVGIVDRLQPYCEYSSAEMSLVVARPVTILRSVFDQDEVIYAELVRQDRSWRIRKLGRTSPSNASWLVRGFQIHEDVQLNLTADAFVGDWWYPCDSTITFRPDGTGLESEVGPFGPNPEAKPERFTWSINRSTLTIRFADRTEKLVVRAIDHNQVVFEAESSIRRSGWSRRQPSE